MDFPVPGSARDLTRQERLLLLKWLVCFNTIQGIFLSKLFEPIRVGRLQLRNRIIMAPMETSFENKEGYVSERLKTFYVERAKGGASLIIVGGASVSSDDSPKLGIYSDECIQSLSNLTKAIHAQGAKVAIQISHGGRKISPKTISMYPFAASSVPSFGKTIPRTLAIGEIENMEEEFANAAFRAKMSGFDAVQIQAAHGYLVWTFLSPLANKRKDVYGRNQAGRMKFLLGLMERTKEVVGNGFPIMVRINGSDYLDGGLTIKESKLIATKLEEAGAATISVSAGETSSQCEYLVPPRAVERGCNVPLAFEIKKSVEVPVSVAGRIDNPLLAGKIIEDGKADLIEMARPLLADPEFPTKAKEGRQNEIRKCIACNRCEDRLNAGLKVECTVNPLAGREWRFGIKPSKKVKRVLVVGGGPGGMEAARVAKLRGHEVTLCEKDKQLGGQVRLSSLVPCKQELVDLISYYEVVLDKLGVKIECGKEVTPDVVDGIEPDVVIAATGAIPLVPRIPGVDRKSVVTANEVLSRNVRVGKEVVIIGGGLVGCETADFLGQEGKTVTIIEMLKDLGMFLDRIRGWNERLLLQRLSEKSVKILIKTKAEEITEEGVKVRRNKKTEQIHADSVVLAVGARSNREIINRIEQKENVVEIGDCIKPRKLHDAVREGFMVTRTI